MKHMFEYYDALSSGYIGALQVQRLHQEIRIGGISLPQVLASIEYKKLDQHRIYLSDLPDLLQEMDRRYYLVQELQWEFALLDHEHRGVIPIKSARFLMEARHGKSFSNKQWERFLNARSVNLAPITFAEIEVPLCNIWKRSEYDIAVDAENEKRRLAEENERRQKARQKAEMEKRKKEEQRKKMKEEEERRKESERLELQAKQKAAEEAHRKEEEERLKNAQEAEADDKVTSASGRCESSCRPETADMPSVG